MKPMMVYAGEITWTQVREAEERMDRGELKSLSVHIRFPYGWDTVTIDDGPELLIVPEEAQKCRTQTILC